MVDQCKDILHLDIIAPMVQVAARAAARAAMSIDGGIIYSKCTRRNNRPCRFCAHVLAGWWLTSIYNYDGSVNATP
jgi:hypothetical protein